MGTLTSNQRVIVGKRLYYCTFVYAVVLSFLISSNFNPILSSKALHRFLYLAVLLLAVKIFGIDQVDRKEWLTKAAIYLLALISWRLAKNVDLLLYISLILAAKQVDFRQLVKLYFGTVGILLLGTVLISLANIIRDVVYIRDGFHRHSLGIIYPTDMAAYVFYLILAYYYLMFDSLTWRSFTIITLLDIAVYWQTQARNSFILILFTIPVIWVAQRAYRGKKVSRAIASYYWMVAPLLAYGTLLLSWLYTSSNGLLRAVNKLLSNRLLLSNQAIDKYGVTLFGQHLVEHGYGGIAGLKQFYNPQAKYFYLDSSYVRLAVIYGLIIGVLLVVFMTVIAYRSTSRHEFILAAVILLISIHCIVEQHLFDISYDPFLISLIAVSPINSNKAKVLGGISGGK